MMTACNDLVELLDGTIEALACLNVGRLEELELRIGLIAEGDVTWETSLESVSAKKRVLELVVKSSEENLKILNQVYGANLGSEWAR